MFKNLTPFITLPEFNLSTETLAQSPAHACGPYDRATVGFVAPADDLNLLHWITPKVALMCLEVEEKILPSSVVKAAAAKYAKHIEEQQGFKPGRNQIREITEQVETDLIQRALTKKRRTYAAIAGEYLLIDTSSASKADELIEVLKNVMGELPLTLVRPVNSPGLSMTQWLSIGECPRAAFTIDRACVLQQRVDELGTVRYKNINVDSDDIRERITNGFTVTELALTYNDRMSFVLTESLTLKKVQLLDLVLEQADVDAIDDDVTLFDSQWLISIEESCAALDELIAALGGRAEA